MNGFYTINKTDPAAAAKPSKHISDGQYIIATLVDNVEADIIYYTQNNIGSTVLLTGDEGELVQGYLYTPFGEMWAKEDGTIIDTNNDGIDDRVDRLFTGQMYDKESGLYYYNARYYDPDIGTFMAPDPSMSGLNHYAYASANPIRYTDPTGMEAENINARDMIVLGARSIAIAAPLVDLAYQAALIAFTISQGGTVPIITIITVIHSLLNFLAAMKSNEIHYSKDKNSSPATSFLGILAQYTSLKTSDKTYENQIRSEFIGSLVDVIDAIFSYFLPGEPILNNFNLIGDLILLEDSFLSYQDILLTKNDVSSISISYNNLVTSINSESNSHDMVDWVEISQVPYMQLLGCSDHEEFYCNNDEFNYNSDEFNNENDEG